MTSDHLDDDALSATLDGEATSEEAAHVDACAACAARLDVLRAAANLIGGPVGPVDPDRRESAIAAALAAAPVSLDARRRRPPTWILSAAAVLLMAFALVPLLSRDTGDRDQSTAAKAAEDSTAEMDDSGGGDAQATLSAPAPAAGQADLGDLGTADLPERLRFALSGAARNAGDRSEEAADPTTTMYATASCEPDLRTTDPDLGPLRLQGTGTYEGGPAVVLVFEVADGLRAVVVAPDDCAVVLRSENFPA